MSEFTLPYKIAADIPRIDEYFGVWAMHAPTFHSLAERCNGVNLTVHATSQAAQQAVANQRETVYPVDANGIATIAIRGPMMKQASSMSGGTSTVAIRQQLRAAMNDPEVYGAILLLDTPGGTVSGNEELATAVAKFAKAKPIYAFTEDMTASAGVSVASQATKRFANNPSALYGSMGTYSVLVDSSQAAEKLGVTVHVIRAGEHKGSGTPGTAITEAQLAEAQRIVDTLNANYLSLIANGLNMPIAKVQALADGRIHPAQDALSMGLIDGIQSYDETLRQLVADVSVRRSLAKRGNVTMSESTNAATLAELKKTFPESTAEWRESQLEAGATMTQAMSAYIGFQKEQMAKEREAHAKALAEAKTAAETVVPPVTHGVGNKPVTLQAGEQQAIGGDSVESFNAMVAQLMAGKPTTLENRFAAMHRIHQKNPALYASYVAANNDSRNPAVQRMVKDKVFVLTEPVNN